MKAIHQGIESAVDPIHILDESHDLMNTTQGFRGCDLNLTEHDGDAIISLGTDDFDEADIGKLRKGKTSA